MPKTPEKIRVNGNVYVKAGMTSEAYRRAGESFVSMGEKLIAAAEAGDEQKAEIVVLNLYAFAEALNSVLKKSMSQ